MGNIIEVTDHAFERLRERSGINRKAAIRLSERAYNKGLKHGETNGDVFKYLSSIANKSQKGCSLRIYGDKVFVFSSKDKNKKPVFSDDGTKIILLVTVLQVPTNLNKKVNILMDKKNNK